MKRIALIVVVLSCFTAFPCSRSFAGYAGLIAPAKKFRLVSDVRLAPRDVEGYQNDWSIQDNLVFPIWVLRFQYGLTPRVRLSGDLVEFGVVYDDDDAGGRTRLEYSVVGLGFQGELWRVREHIPLEVSAGYWVTQVSGSGRTIAFPCAKAKDRSLAVTLAGELPRSPANRLYFGPLYSHVRLEKYTADLRVTSGLSSHRDLGLIGGGDARLFGHVVLNLEGFWTGDYGGSGSLGWEF